MENKRQLGLGGSDIAVLCGASSFERTPLDIYMEKVFGQFKPFAREYYQKRGLALEQVLLESWLDLNPQYRSKEYEIITNFRLVHGEVKFFHGHVDCVIYKGDKIVKILEFKAPTYMDGSWGEPGSFDVPDYIKVQTQWYIEVARHAVDSSVKLNNLLDIVVDSRYAPVIYKAHYDYDEVAFMKAKGRHFWNMHVLSKNPPPASTIQDLNQIFTSKTGAILDGDSELYQTALTLDGLRDNLKLLTKKEEELKLKIASILKDNEAGCMDGSRFVTGKTQVTRRPDNQLLKTAYPDVYEAVCKEVTSRPIKTYFK